MRPSLKKCDHEYVSTSKWLPEIFGICCKKCGKQLSKHKELTYLWRLKESAKITATAWSGFMRLDYRLALESLIEIAVFLFLILVIAIMPLLFFVSPIIALVGWVSQNRKQRRRVRDLFSEK